jgi:hypothetical protein
MRSKTAGVKNPAPRRTQPKMTPKQKAIADGLAKRKQHQKKK